MNITDIKFGHNTFDVVLCPHVRWYGRCGFKDRLTEAGFFVTIEECKKMISKDDVKRMCLLEDEEIYFCKK